MKINYSKFQDKDFKSEYDINNYGDNINLPVLKSRQNETSSNINLKFILFWNEAYGSKVNILV